MKIYVFTDPHGNTKALSQMQKNVKSEKPDLLICTGDLTIFESNMKKLLKEIEKLKVPTLMLHGNHETEESLRKTCEKLQHITFLHKELFEMKGYTFAAYGGGGFDQKDTELEQQFKTWKNLNWKKTIFLSHAPPYKTAMDDVGEFDEALACRQQIAEKDDEEVPTLDALRWPHPRRLRHERHNQQDARREPRADW
jgi:Icc-related predicted phosphoesterase